VPAASDQLPRDSRGARVWVFVPKAVFFANTIACLIDTSISKVLGLRCSTQRDPWGNAQVQATKKTSASWHAAVRTTQMKFRLCRPSVLAAELDGSLLGVPT
jgi:hypothetical protein